MAFAHMRNLVHSQVSYTMRGIQMTARALDSQRQASSFVDASRLDAEAFSAITSYTLRDTLKTSKVRNLPTSPHISMTSSRLISPNLACTLRDTLKSGRSQASSAKGNQVGPINEEDLSMAFP